MMHEFLGIHMWWWLLWIIFIITIIYLLTTNTFGKPLNNNKNAEEILKERYAKGEISREEYLKKLEDLKK
jgi:putative membrane protein